MKEKKSEQFPFILRMQEIFLAIWIISVTQEFCRTTKPENIDAQEMINIFCCYFQDIEDNWGCGFN